MSAPHRRAGRDLRLLRAAVFAAVCVLLSAAGHGLASCETLPLWTLGAGFLAVFAVAAALAGRERSLPGITGVLAVGQVTLHALFGLGQRHGTTMTVDSADAALVERAARLLCGTTTAAISPARARRVLAEAGLDPAAQDTAQHTATSTSVASAFPSLAMLLGHVLAAVAAGWLLRHGDLALLRLSRLSGEYALVRSLRGALALVRALRTGLPGAPDAAPHVPLGALRAPSAPRTTALQHSVIRRGPPAAAAFRLAA
ncbi:hypothetical protein [Streptomyces cavernae]|uniref:hypothetical protein n=1 Tax=Streptomyces cavernae TaxID=2259034 RepID=UPI00192E7518|nr:hypothetical protein [Streptomyces cavernae]